VEVVGKDGILLDQDQEAEVGVTVVEVEAGVVVRVHHQEIDEGQDQDLMIINKIIQDETRWKIQ
jgi:hypothetical protein